MNMRQYFKSIYLVILLSVSFSAATHHQTRVIEADVISTVPIYYGYNRSMTDNYCKEFHFITRICSSIEEAGMSQMLKGYRTELDYEGIRLYVSTKNKPLGKTLKVRVYGQNLYQGQRATVAR
ncbi:hypothetical protein BHECKSOX_2052 [Bathymodiolus heckerae thiotrophic gill symbiont]|nr:hypothetical protein [uncultured Gammaproteobacteria bacterium]SHN91661.1 hypothetical protein BHECKSOX_2052 [Bathymodiolus heckerae thiotrophic gill symbiont]